MALDRLTKITSQSGIKTTLDYQMSDLTVDTITIRSGGGIGGGRINTGLVTVTTLTPSTVVYVGTGQTLTESDNLTWDNTNVRLKNLGITSTKDLNVTGVSTFAGLVGINEASPQQQLHVHADTIYRGIFVNGSAAPRIGFARDTTTTGEWSVGVDGTNGAQFAINNSDGNSNRKLIISSSKIELYNNTTVTGGLTVSGIITGSSFSGIDSDKIEEGNTKAEVVDGGSNGHFLVETEGDERLRIDKDGYVGIKLTDPSVYYAKDLVIKCIDQGGITLKSTGTSDTQYLMFADGTSGNERYRGYVGYQHNTGSGGGEHIQIAAGGGTGLMRYYGDGKLLLDQAASYNVFAHSKLQISATDALASASFTRWSANAYGPYINLGKSRGAVGAYTAVQDDDHLGTINFAAADGTDIESVGAAIMAEVDGTIAGNRTPGSLVLKTTADSAGSASATERFRISSSGDVSIGGCAVNTFSNYQTLTIGGARAVDGVGIDLERSGGNIHGRFFADANGIQLQTTQSGDYFRFETNNGTAVGERVRITDNGKLTLNYGATPPSEDVMICTSGQASPAGVTLSHLASGNRYGFRVQSISGTNQGIKLYALFNSSYTERLEITDSGATLSRTANSGNTLTIKNNNNTQNSAGAKLQIEAGDAANNGAILQLEQNGAYHTIESRSNGQLYIGDNGTNKAYLDSSGNFGLNDGNFVVPDGYGINFSATGGPSGGTTSVGSFTASGQILKDYEEGTWTPRWIDVNNTPTYYNQIGKYVKVGKVVHLWGFIQTWVKPTFANPNGVLQVGGVPFSVQGVGYIGGCGGSMTVQSVRWSGSTYNDYGNTVSNGGWPMPGMSGGYQQFYVSGHDSIRGTVRRNAAADTGGIWEWYMTYNTTE